MSRIRSTVDEKEQKQLLMDLDVVMRSSDCPYIVQFYGALFREGDCWICMELMSTSFDKFYKYVYSVLDDVIPEEILGKITLATVKALNHLKENLKIIHRDIKPSNILLDRNGNIKLCDFGISGQLVDSIAKTRDAGCRPYMAPERIDPSASRQGYDVRSDVWSLGITLYELATGRFPYPKWNSVFDQLTQVVKGDPPQLSNSEEREFSPSFINFVNLCFTFLRQCEGEDLSYFTGLEVMGDLSGWGLKDRPLETALRGRDEEKTSEMRVCAQERHDKTRGRRFA
uniref:mitogen-activated protein kinase kinase n=1 Tax=Buteo japonicus TaxID=224669 RepID=A0A8B9YYU1_9AVES